MNDVSLRNAYTAETWKSHTGINKRIKDDLESKNGKVCLYCGQPYSATGSARIDHFLPRAVYPKLTYEPFNLVLSCERCNRKKWDDDYIEGCCSEEYLQNKFLIVHPLIDDPKDNFDSESGPLIKPLTQKGLKSCRLFGINSEQLLQIRARALMIDEERGVSSKHEKLIDSICKRTYIKH